MTFVGEQTVFGGRIATELMRQSQFAYFREVFARIPNMTPGGRDQIHLHLVVKHRFLLKNGIT